ncbi:VOC family protein [Paenibacillus sp. J5C_2022]|uniref:VOC family protein n=1 Tax=Paenibacillus sp. J5C2022 TaxID=2977129 RepID=UPI0021D17D77|nr:VOC family protein [Paenibacillus sp. J5C2022]MCU6711380.1 VOC family protein [Paenibacillus sp. J5C2022]
MDESIKNKGITGEFVQGGKPSYCTTLTPFIVVDKPSEAIEFYEAVFGAKAKSVTEFEIDGNKMIVHADIDFGNGFLQLGAANPAYRLVLPPGDGNACYSLGIYVPDADKTLALAIEQGATVREQAANFVSGDRYCSILDPYGIRWSIMTRVEDISEEESYRRVAEWSKSQTQ